MQKISSYLYSNRIAINLDLASSPLEWRIVYQRKIKIYKGFENVIELDIKNTDQKRIDVSDKTLRCVLMDTFGQEVYTAEVVHSDTPGLATFSIPSDSVEILNPQFLRYTVYILNNDYTKSIVYGDTQFGATGTMELIGSAIPQTLLPQVINTFLPLHDTVSSIPTYYSECVEINPPNDIVEDPELTLEFHMSSLEGDVSVEFAKDPVVSTATVWTTVETFAVTTSTTILSNVYGVLDGFNSEAGWLRISYVRADNNTGKIDKVLVSL